MNFFDSLSSIKLGDVSLSSVFSALIVYVLCYIAIKILCKAFEKILDSSRHIDASLKSFFRSAIKAVLSVAGVALSLALQGLLSNLFSGITLLTTHPFKVGDYVEISGQSGTVKSIGLFYTGLATVDNRMIYAPNGSVTSGQIVNFSAEDLRRVIISVTASYDSATEDVRAACLDAIGMIDKALSDPPPFAAISSYGSSSIEYTVRTWCKTEDYWDVYFALNENLRTCFEKHGVEMCYDHLNVHLVNDK